GAALYGSNMENYELLTQSQHRDEGKLSGPVVNSPRQLWSVGAYFAVVTEGVFGLDEDGSVQPKLPTSLVPMLFGDRTSISITLPERSITLELPRNRTGNLLVADRTSTKGKATTIELKAITVKGAPLRTDAPLYAPRAPDAPTLAIDGDHWTVKADGKVRLYVNGQRAHSIDGSGTLPRDGNLTCVSAVRVDGHGLESLHSPAVCGGELAPVTGSWPRSWKAPKDGAFRVSLNYTNDLGPINTGITAAVKMLSINCDGSAEQRLPIVMAQSVREERSTYGQFNAQAGATCHFALKDGFNMSYLSQFSHYTGGVGGADGPLNKADVHGLIFAPLGSASTAGESAAQ
ncbi:MAG: Six-hairpin glycosidase-like protein, partial [Pseudomonadota bacterium]|nr:Six-hairpin glycosidase-like protein [Pseudomonadota bacterium]